MTWTRLVCALLVAPALLAVSGSRAGAEVTVIMNRGRVVGTLEMKDPDLDPPLIWGQVRSHADPAHLLNPDGDQHSDGPPSVTFDPVSGLPEAVWAMRAGAASDVAWSRFDGSSWTPPMMLTSDGMSLGPRLSIDASGNRRLVYWRRGIATSGSDAVMVTALAAGETLWWEPRQVSEEGIPTRWPDVRAFPGIGTFIVAEEETPDGLSVAVFESPVIDGTPQRDTEPWGRVLLHEPDLSGARLYTELIALPSAGGAVPVIHWIEGTQEERILGTIYYDLESMTWSTATFSPAPTY